jgi:hypothetical protein
VAERATPREEAGEEALTLILRRLGRGNWSPLVLQYEHERQGQLPALLQAKRGDRLPIAGIVYRVSKVMP